MRFPCRPIVVLLISLLPLSAASAAYEAGRAVGQWFWVAIFAALLLKALRQTRAPGASRLCTIALAVVSGGLLLSMLLQLLLPIASGANPYAAIPGALAVLIGGPLSLVAIILYRREQYSSGRGSGITALVISVIFLAIAVGGFIRASQRGDEWLAPAGGLGLSQAEQYQDRLLNFEIRRPPGYISLEATAFNPDACWAIRKQRAQVFHAVIAERLGTNLAINDDQLVELCRSNLLSAGFNARFSEPRPTTINGVDGLSLQADATVNGRAARWLYWLSNHNGYCYQFISTGLASEGQTMSASHAAVLDGFRLIDPTAIYRGEGVEAYGQRTNPSWAYTVDLRTSAWLPWDQTSNGFKLAEEGLYLDDDNGALIYCFRHGGEPPQPRLLREVLCTSLGVTNPERALEVGEAVSDGSLRWDPISCSSLESGRLWHYRMRHYRGQAVDMLVVVWSSDATVPAAEALFAAIRPEPSANPSWPPADPAVAARQALINNRIGLAYHKQQHYQRALTSFQAAVALDDADPAYVTNVFDTLSNLGRWQEALDWYDGLDRPASDGVTIQSWQAWCHAQVEAHEQAVAIYRPLFAGGYHNDEDFVQYLTCLTRLDQPIDDAVAAYDPEGSSDLVQEGYASLLQDRGDHDAALAILDRLTAQRPDDPSLAMQRFVSLDAQEQYTAIVDRATALIEQGQDSANLWVWRGDAEQALGWHRAAKASYERALALNPSLDHLKDTIRSLAGLLGGGDTINVTTPIEAVALPPVLAALRDQAFTAAIDPAYDAQYHYRFDTLHVVPGEVIRRSFHRRVRIDQQGALSTYSTLQFPFNPLYQRIYINEVTVRSADGQVRARGDVADCYVIDEQGQMKTYDRILYMPVPGLEVGDLLEYVVTIDEQGACEDLGFDRIWLCTQRPIAHAALAITGDLDGLGIVERRCTATTIDNGRLWLVEQPRVFHPEVLGPRVEGDYPAIELASAATNWATVGDAEYAAIAERLTIDDALARRAQELVAAADDDRQRVTRLWDEIRSKVVYQAIEFGTRGRMPNTPATTLSQKYGDCKDMSVLLRGLCKAVDIPAELALVNNDMGVVAAIPHADQFNHMIVHLPGIGFVDPTQDFMLDLDQAPLGLGGQQALLLRPSGSELVDIGPRPGPSTLSSSRRCLIDEQGLVVTEQTTVDRFFAAFLRANLRTSTEAERRQWYLDLLSEGNRGAELDSLHCSGLDAANGSVVLESRYRLPLNLHRGDTQLTVDLPAPWVHYYIDYQHQHTRHNDYEINYGLQLRSDTTLIVPDGYTAPPADQASDDRQPGLDWQYRRGPIANGYGSTLELTLHAGRHPRDRFADFVRSCQRAITLPTQSIRLELRNRP